MNDIQTVDLGKLGEDIQGASFVLGQSSGLDIAARSLRERSGVLFARGGCDSLANEIRNEAAKLEALSCEFREKYDRFDCCGAENAAFRELDAVTKALEEKKIILLPLDEETTEGQSFEVATKGHEATCALNSGGYACTCSVHL